MSIEPPSDSRWRRWWRRYVVDDDPMDDDWMRWEHWAHCTDLDCPCHRSGRL